MAERRKLTPESLEDALTEALLYGKNAEGISIWNARDDEIDFAALAETLAETFGWFDPPVTMLDPKALPPLPVSHNHPPVIVVYNPPTQPNVFPFPWPELTQYLQNRR